MTTCWFCEHLKPYMGNAYLCTKLNFMPYLGIGSWECPYFHKKEEGNGDIGSKSAKGER